MKTEAIAFSNDGIRLAGTLYKPDVGGVHPCLIVLHGSGMGARTDSYYVHLYTRLPEVGIAVFLFDRRGSGESEGDFQTSDFGDLAGDAAAAFEALQARDDIHGDKIFVYGISQGGWIAPIVAARQPRVAGIVVVSGSGVSPARQMDYAAEFAMHEAGFGEDEIAKAIALRGRVNEYFRGNLTRADLLQDLVRAENERWYVPGNVWDRASLPEDVTTSKWYYEMDFPPVAIWDKVHQPTLFIFAGVDRWVPIAESVGAFRTATAHLRDVEFAQIEGTDHVMVEHTAGGEVVSEKYVTTLIGWLKKHADAAPA